MLSPHRLPGCSVNADLVRLALVVAREICLHGLDELLGGEWLLCFSEEFDLLCLDGLVDE